MELEVGAEFVCCMQTDDVDHSQGWGNEDVMEGDKRSKVTPDGGFSFLKAEQW